MYISMQGAWTVSVKSKNASYAQQYIISGADSNNGTYPGTTSQPARNITGRQWSIAIMHNPGAGFQISDTKITTPKLLSGVFSFDIQSNDSGGDTDFDDLVLTCSRTAGITDYIIYGRITLYQGRCVFNPCYPKFAVIDTYPQLREALKIEKIRAAIEKLYPERIPVPGIPNPPDPPDFKPMMFRLDSDLQLPSRILDVYTPKADRATAKKKDADSKSLTEFQVSTTRLSPKVAETFSSVIDRVKLGQVVDVLGLRCNTEPGAGISLNFFEYDRTAAELAGGAYTGEGHRLPLGSTISDFAGNYIFHFEQDADEFQNELEVDIAPGEDSTVYRRPDLIARITDLMAPDHVIYESAPVFNVSKLHRWNFCLPKSKVYPTSFCFNGNLLGSLGNVFIGGAQNTSASFAGLDREGYGNHLHADGKVTVKSPLAGFASECACWGGRVDFRGCLYNLQRKKTDPIIKWYTIRFRKPGNGWQFVQEVYRHPRFSKRFLPGYHGDLVGPFVHTLKVDGTNQAVPAYKNIQAETYFDGIDWEFANLDRYIQLNTGIYEAGEAGTVYFLIEGYDAAGKLVPNARDMIALFINNRAIDFSLGNIHFVSPIEHLPCNLYRLAPSELNTPLQLQFQASDLAGFTDFYQLTMGKCPAPVEVTITSPAVIAGTVSDGILAAGAYGSSDAEGCAPYTGTRADFSTGGLVTVTLQPSVAAGGWLANNEQFAILSFGLQAAVRRTNGYNSGTTGVYQASASIYLEPKP